MADANAERGSSAIRCSPPRPRNRWLETPSLRSCSPGSRSFRSGFVPRWPLPFSPFGRPFAAFALSGRIRLDSVAFEWPGRDSRSHARPSSASAAGGPRGFRGLIERGREQQAAATRAEMYRLSSRMIAYRARFGAYPSRVSDLERLEDGVPVIAARDAWDHRLVYAAFTTGIASRGRVPTLSANFELRSPGADGVPNTADDIVMRDGQIVDAASADPAPAGRLPMTVPVSNRFR